MGIIFDGDGRAPFCTGLCSNFVSVRIMFYMHSTFNQLSFPHKYKMNALGTEIGLIGKIIELLVVDFPFNQQLGILYHHKEEGC